MSKTILVVGAGPGVSGSVARRFAREGYDVALAGTDEEALKTLGAQVQDLGRTAGWRVVDITDAEAFADAVRAFGDHADGIDVLHFNPSVWRGKSALELSPAELETDLRVGASALLTAVQAARPYLSAGARITATGSMAADEPDAGAASLGVQKAALRNLVVSLDGALREEGIRAVSVTVRGVLSDEGPFTPDRVAEQIYAAAHQDEGSWRTEIAYSG